MGGCVLLRAMLLLSVEGSGRIITMVDDRTPEKRSTCMSGQPVDFFQI